MWEHSPGTTAVQFIEYAVNDFTHINTSRFTTGLWNQRFENFPFCIIKITGVWFSFHNPLIYSIFFIPATFQTRS